MGVIDVGSNSVRMVVFDGAARSPAYFFNEKVLCGLGRGIAETGMLHPDGRARAFRAMQRFAALAHSFHVQSLTAVATAAVRDASDGAEFCEQVRAATGIEIEVIEGKQEARFAAQGVLLGRPQASGLVSDIGGASMELAELVNGQVGTCMTSPLAPLRLADVTGDVDAYIRDHLMPLRGQFSAAPDTLFLVGGSYRAFAKIDMARRGYPLEVLHEYVLSADQVAETVDWIGASDSEDLAHVSSSSSGRLALVPMAARVLKQVVAVFEPNRISVSSYGLREGMLYQQMPDDLRRRDPLIEACRMMERTAARFVGFGEVLAAWVSPLLPQDSHIQRVVLAAGLLHDVSWRSDPSSRAEECFDNAMRGNLGGIGHQSRVMLAMALLHRYRKSGKIEKYKTLRAILSEEEQRAAQVIGKAMRLGASLAGGDGRVLSAATLQVTQTEIELHLDPSIADFGGEVVETRLRELAATLGKTGRLNLR